MATLRKIRRPRLTELVTEQLAASIREGAPAPGERLPTERELSERFGVSRNVVREAVQELRARGLVTTRQGSGSVVTTDIQKPIRVLMADLLTGRDGAEGKLLELRRSLEVQIAELAAERARKAEIRDMEQILEAFDAATDDLERCAELDIAFHQALCRAAHNELFGVVVESVNDLLMPARRRALERSGTDVASTSHRALLAAIRAHDPQRAATCMAEHMDLTMRTWKQAKHKT